MVEVLTGAELNAVAGAGAAGSQRNLTLQTANAQVSADLFGRFFFLQRNLTPQTATAQARVDAETDSHSARPAALVARSLKLGVGYVVDRSESRADHVQRTVSPTPSPRNKAHCSTLTGACALWRRRQAWAVFANGGLVGTGSELGHHGGATEIGIPVDIAAARTVSRWPTLIFLF